MTPSSRASNGLVAAVVLISGCGGGGGSSSAAPADPDTGPGRAAVSIVWPSRGRDVPLAANSVSIAVLRQGKAIQTSLRARPDDGSPSVISFSNLPLGTLDVRMSSFTSADGTGAVLSVGTASVVPIEGDPMPVAVTMAPVVASLTLASSTVSVPQNATTELSIRAVDAVGAPVGLAPDSVAWTSDAPGTATVVGNGSTATVTGVAVGFTTVHATLTRADGSTLTVAALVTVSGTGGIVTVH